MASRWRGTVFRSRHSRCALRSSVGPPHKAACRRRGPPGFVAARLLRDDIADSRRLESAPQQDDPAGGAASVEGIFRARFCAAKPRCALPAAPHHRSPTSADASSTASSSRSAAAASALPDDEERPDDRADRAGTRRPAWFDNMEIAGQKTRTPVQQWATASAAVSEQDNHYRRTRTPTRRVDRLRHPRERCHGSPRATPQHAPGRRRRAIAPTRLDPAASSAICAQCHLRDVIGPATPPARTTRSLPPILEPRKESDPTYWADGRAAVFERRAGAGRARLRAAAPPAPAVTAIPTS